jgi:hypothetical protein
MDASRFERLTRHLAARTSRRTALGSALAGLALGGLHPLAAAQDATPAPDGTPAAGEKPVFMFVQTAISGRGEVNPNAGTPAAGGTPVPGGGAPFLLTLRGHSGQTIYFSDRPDRLVGATPTEPFLQGLGFESSNPPNAALVAEGKAGQGVVVLQLVEPVYDAAAETLTYGADVLEGYEGANLAPVLREQVALRLPAEVGASALFIDDCPDINACLNEGGFYIGPVPGGPYGQCWQGLFRGGCEPCWYTRSYLDGLCNATYSRCNGKCYAYGYH